MGKGKIARAIHNISYAIFAHKAELRRIGMMISDSTGKAILSCLSLSFLRDLELGEVKT